MPAKINHSAIYYKGCCGRRAYDIATIKEFCKLKADIWDIYVNNEIVFENFSTGLVMGFNGKISAGGMILNPFAVINDGLVDFSLIPMLKFTELVKLLKQAKEEGTQCYD